MSKKGKGIVRPDFSRERDQKLDLSEMFAASIATQVLDADGKPGTSMEGARLLPLDLIDHNPYQARQAFDVDALQELADSIREHGVIEPIVVRPNETHEGRYEIVAGERRYRAAMLAEQEAIPARIMELDSREAAILTALENLQREDLDIEDEARQFDYLCQILEVSQRELARMLGKNPVYISRRVRLMKRPDLMEEYRAGRLTLLQAAALAGPIAGEEGAESDSRRITLSQSTEESEPVEAAEAGAEVDYTLIEREDLPGFIVARPDPTQQSDSARITSTGSPAAGTRSGGARRPLFRWRPLQQFHNWVDRTRIADVPPDERATVRRQLTEIKEALEKQLAELEQLQGGAEAGATPERRAESEPVESSPNSPPR